MAGIYTVRASEAHSKCCIKCYIVYNWSLNHIPPR